MRATHSRPGGFSVCYYLGILKLLAAPATNDRSPRYMERALAVARAEHHFELDVIDIDRDAQLVARYGALIPVLMAGATQICCYRLDRKAFDAYFQKLQ